MTHSPSPWTLLESTVKDRGWLTLSEKQIQQFQTLFERVLEANKITNLTRIVDEAEFVNRHLLDSLTLAPLLNDQPAGFKLIDIGSGGGFPALPLAIAYPKATIVAVESVQKKARLIQEFADNLGLTNLTVMPERAETLGRNPKYREQFDVATARAVGTMNLLSELCLPFVKPGGLWIAMKIERTLEAELRAAENAMETLGGALGDIISGDLPGMEHHVLAVIEKVHATPKDYPRTAGLPAKSPL